VSDTTLICMVRRGDAPFSFKASGTREQSLYVNKVYIGGLTIAENARDRMLRRVDATSPAAVSFLRGRTEELVRQSVGRKRGSVMSDLQRALVAKEVMCEGLKPTYRDLVLCTFLRSVQEIRIAKLEGEVPPLKALVTATTAFTWFLARQPQVRAPVVGGRHQLQRGGGGAASAQVPNSRSPPHHSRRQAARRGARLGEQLH
jgi:hypothetical protein